jgi:hypothetical protein
MWVLMDIYAKHLALPNALVINFTAKEPLTLTNAQYQNHVRISQELVQMPRNALLTVQSTATIQKYNALGKKMKWAVLEPSNVLKPNVLMIAKPEIRCGATNIVQHIVRQENYSAEIIQMPKDAQNRIVVLLRWS